MLIFFLLFQMCYLRFSSWDWDKNAEYSPLPMTHLHLLPMIFSQDLFSNCEYACKEGSGVEERKGHSPRSGKWTKPHLSSSQPKAFFSSCHCLFSHVASQGCKPFFFIHLVPIVSHQGGGCYLWCHILCLTVLGTSGKYSAPIIHSCL